MMRRDEYFLLNTDDVWGLFLVNAPYYPKEFFDNMDKVLYISSDENAERILIKTIGRNELRRKNFDIWGDIGRIFHR